LQTSSLYALRAQSVSQLEIDTFCLKKLKKTAPFALMTLLTQQQRARTSIAGTRRKATSLT
jgi:hypothetical protein